MQGEQIIYSPIVSQYGHKYKLKQQGLLVCHKLPARAKNSMAREMRRTRAILRWTRQMILIIEMGDKIRYDMIT